MGSLLSKLAKDTIVKTTPESLKGGIAGRTLKLAPDAIPTKLKDIDIDIAATKQKLGRAKQTTKTKFEQLEAAQIEVEQKIDIQEEIPDLTAINTQQEMDLAIKRSEVQRDIALRINELEMEKRATEIVGQGKAKGLSTYDSLYNMVSEKAGSGEVFSNQEARGKAIYTRVSANMTDLKDALRTKWAGLTQDIEMGHDVIRYLKDNNLKNKDAVKYGKEWTAGANQMTGLRNKAGGKVHSLEDWVIPQTHNKFNLRKAGLNEWKKFIRPLLDVERMEKQIGKPVDEILDNAFVSLTSPEVKNSSFSANMAKRHQERRVIHYKDGDSIINYNKEFGNPDVFGTMDNYLRSQSQEIAAMQLFGANPDKLFNKMKDLARADGMGNWQENKLDALWDIVLGEADGDNIVNTADKIIATIGGGHRVLQTGAKLGSAQISAIADVGNIYLGAGYRGLNGFKIMGTGLETLTQEALGGTKIGNNTDFASRLGIVSEFASASLANSKYAEATQTGGLAKTSEAVLRASGLGSWTNSLRAGFGLELNSRFFQDFNMKFDDLSYNNMFTEYGITAKDWDKIRSTKGREIKSDSFSADFLDMEAVYKIDEELGYKLSELISTEMDAFVIMPTARTRVYTTAGKKKGTLSGELMRNVTLFKSFPISVMQMHAARWAKMTGGGKAAYTAGAVTSSVMFGGVALMAYDVVTGKTPRSIDRKEFPYEALVKGGGMGIFEDLFNMGTVNRYGHGWLGTLVGVPYGTLEDISGIVSDVNNELRGEDRNVMANAYNRAKRYIPGQNLWYTRTLFSETLGDFMQEAIDPKYYQKEMRKMKYMKQRDQEYLFR